MAGFRKATTKQAALKLGMYGPPGSGKTFSALLIGEGLGKHFGKRVAFVDTEHGTDFYSKTVPDRSAHPEGFDFDALYTKSLTETLAACLALDPKDYCLIVIDSITHLWEAAKAAYSGKTAGGGQIPFHAWGKIKKPYKDLITFLLNTPMHVIICGRQGLDYQEDDNGDLKVTGAKMKAEGETAYEPHILLRMESVKSLKGKTSTITAYVEKDRTGVLQGKLIEWPSFANIATPILPLLGAEQATMPTEDETSIIDADALAEAERQKALKSQELFDQLRGEFGICHSAKEIEALSKKITPAIKKTMTTAHVEALRTAFLEATNRVSGKVHYEQEGQS